MSKLRSVLFLILIPLWSQASPPVIENPADPPLVETWNLREVWRLDCEEDESLPLMGVIVQAVIDDAGHTLLLDSQLAQVIEIGPEGEFLGTLSRSGQGPGELERPSTLFLADDGTLGLVQTYPGKVVFVNRDDTPAGSMTARGDNPMFYSLRDNAGYLVGAGQTMNMVAQEGRAENIRHIGRYDREGEPLNTFLEGTVVAQYDPPVSDEGKSWFPNWAWDQAPDGSVIIATRRDEYRFEWSEPEGGLRRVVTRDFEPYRRTKADKEKVAETMRMWGPEGEIEPRKVILDTEPAIKTVRVMRDGSFWVKSCYADRDLPEGIHVRYDVFDTEGLLVKEVRIALAIDEDTDYFGMSGDGRFFWYRGMKSAQDAQFAHMEGGADEPDDDPVPVQIILMERTP